MTPSPVDLFGEVPVTRDDVEIWIDVVPGWPRSTGSARRDNYARSWNVPDKIRAAKLAGRWPEIEKARTEQLRALLGDTDSLSAFYAP